MRAPSATPAPSSVPLRVTECTSAVMASMKVDAPAEAVKRTVVTDRNVVSLEVRSSSMS